MPRVPDTPSGSRSSTTASRWRLAALAAGACLCAAFAAQALHPDHPDDEAGGKHEVADESPESPSVLPGAGCEDGVADAFACDHVELLAWLTRSSLGLGQLNDVWGWTDPVTGTEYAIVGLRDAVAFVDLADPENPVHVGTLPTQTSPSIWNDMKVYGDYAFVVSEAIGHGMQVFDLALLRTTSDPPETFAPAALYARFSKAHNIAIDEETARAFVVGSNTCRGGLHIVDIADPLNPRFAGCFAADGYTHDAQCVVYRGPDSEHAGREICFASNEDTLTIVDVTDAASPVMLSRSGYLGQRYTHQGWLGEDHAYFFVDDEFDELTYGIRSRTYVWDVSDLDAPVLAGAHAGATGSIDHNQYTLGDHLFQANYTSGLRILRMGDLSRGELIEVGSFDTYPNDDRATFDGAWSVYPYFASGIVVVSDINRGLFVLRPDLNGVPRCADGLDNDFDGLTDYPEDPACAGPQDASEAPRNDVVVDIKPDTATNPVNPDSNGVIPVAVFGEADFDVAAIDPATLRFGPDGAPPAHQKLAHFEDVDGDGHTDLVSHFRTQQTGIARGDWTACLAFDLHDGTSYEGCDLANTLPGCGPGAELALVVPPLARWRRRRRSAPGGLRRAAR